MCTFENVDRYMKRQFDYICPLNMCIFIWKNTNNLVKANIVIYCARLMYYINKKKQTKKNIPTQKINMFVYEIAYYGSLFTN